MTKGLLHRLFRVFTCALVGYMWGWIWGWSVFDPNSDLWALAAGLGAIAGLLLGLFFPEKPHDSLFLSGTLGLYLGWILRTALLGDVPGGWGLLLMAAGCLLGAAAGIAINRGSYPSFSIRLTAALYAGFFGGFLVDVIALDKLPGWPAAHSILSRAPGVIVCGIIGGLLAPKQAGFDKRAEG
jgi:hypothetical protein